MTRPEHLNVPNTPEGIRAINEMQRVYDEDPQGYERREQQHREELQQQQEDEERQQREQIISQE